MQICDLQHQMLMSFESGIRRWDDQVQYLMIWDKISIKFFLKKNRNHQLAAGDLDDDHEPRDI